MTILAGTHQPLKAKGEELEQEESSPIEDLMREHGVVERILLIYQRILEKAITGQEIDISAINAAARLVDSYVSDHHEKDEESYIFPKFREANYIVELVDTLENQHDVAREVNRQILDLSSKGATIGQEDLIRLLDRCGMFINMYLPHISRENTILFPAFFDIVSREYIQEIKEKMEDEEEQALGDTGFRGLIGRLSELEKQVGCHDLDQYTAQLREPDTTDQP